MSIDTQIKGSIDQCFLNMDKTKMHIYDIDDGYDGYKLYIIIYIYILHTT